MHTCYQYCIQNIAVAHTHKKMLKRGVELKSYNSLQYLAGLRTRSIFKQVQVRVHKVFTSSSSAFQYFRVR